MTDLDVSPCRCCAKQAKLTCRSRCKRLKEYQNKAGISILTRGYGQQYDGELYGIKKTLSNIIPVVMQDTPLSETEGRTTSFAPDFIPPSSRRYKADDER